MQEEQNFDTLEVGKEYPPFSYQLDEGSITKYIEAVEDNEICAIAGKLGKKVAPPTIASVYFLQAFYWAFPNRPKGNVHAKQRLCFCRPIQAGDVLKTYLKIADKYEKKGRKYVLIDILSKNQLDETVLAGLMTLIWAR